MTSLHERLIRLLRDAEELVLRVLFLALVWFGLKGSLVIVG